MATPSPRNSIRIARGLYADLLASIADLGVGELCYGIDHDKFYTPDGQGGLAEVGAGTAIATLGQIGDVDLAGLQSGQVLKWNGASWVPGNDSSAVSSVAGKTGDVTLVLADITDFDSSDYVQPGDLAAVATTGSYDDLTDKPTIPPAYDDSALEARVSENENDISQLQTDVGNIPSIDPNTVTTDSVPTFTVTVETTERTITAGAFDLAAWQPLDLWRYHGPCSYQCNRWHLWSDPHYRWSCRLE